jgi:signal transduction histidine kinase
VLLLGFPFAGVVASLYLGQAETRLDGEAARVVAALPDEALAATNAALPAARRAHTTLGVYSAAGYRMSGDGPKRDSLVRRTAAQLDEQRTVRGGDVVVALPFRREQGQVVVIRAAAPFAEVTGRVHRTWAVMSAVAAAVLAVAFAVATKRAKSLAVPFERLTADTEALGRGEFALRARVSGLVEADAAELALEETARRLGGLLARERAFSADASHQLRTPLTRLRLGLEGALLDPDLDREAALREAVGRLDALEATVTGLLRLARDTGGAQQECDVHALVTRALETWTEVARGAGRRLQLRFTAGIARAMCSPVALAQVLDVLLDNALQHGEGQVLVTVRTAGPGIAVDVSDEGAGLGTAPELAFTRRSPDARGTGIGLALARSLTEAEGARLEVSHPGPRPVFTILLAAADRAEAPA